MDFEVKYDNENFLELDSSVRDAYKKGLESIRKSDDFKECSDRLNLILKALKESKCTLNRPFGWADATIRMYRNLAEIYDTILSDENYDPILSNAINPSTGEKENLEKLLDL